MPFCATHFSDRYFPIIQQLRISLSGGKYIPRFLFIGLGSLLFPQLLYFVPLFYLGMISFRSLSLKSFFAGLTGLCVPYWLFFGYAFYYDKMNLFYHPLQELIHFQPISYGTLGMDRIISCGIITLISLVSSVHYFHVSYLDKVRTRIFLFSWSPLKPGFIYWVSYSHSISTSCCRCRSL